MTRYAAWAAERNGTERDIPEEVLERVLLQVLLGEVLQVALGEGDLRGEDELVACLSDAAFGVRSAPSLPHIL